MSDLDPSLLLPNSDALNKTDSIKIDPDSIKPESSFEKIEAKITPQKKDLSDKLGQEVDLPTKRLSARPKDVDAPPGIMCRKVKEIPRTHREEYDSKTGITFTIKTGPVRNFGGTKQKDPDYISGVEKNISGVTGMSGSTGIFGITRMSGVPGYLVL